MKIMKRLNEEHEAAFIFFWQPGLVRPIKISGQQKLFGDAGIAFAKYTVKSKEETKLDNKEALKLNLVAKSPSKTYSLRRLRSQILKKGAMR